MQYSRVLLIDDDEDDRELFLMAMKDVASNVDCQALDDAKTALHLLETRELTADVIFLDLNMPIMDGKGFLMAIKANEMLKEIPVIILSTSSSSKSVQETTLLGAMSFLTKPNNYNDLKHIIQSILE